MNAATEFDVGPLTWVKSEIDLALERAAQALQLYSESASTGLGDLTQIKFCRTHLHQVQGALTIVGLDGVTQFAESVEAMLEALEQQKRPSSEAAIELARRSLAAIGHYLDDLVSGQPNQPLRLLSLYREVQAERGLSRISATDLFFPDLSVRPPRRESPARKVPAGELSKLLRQERARFQRGFLSWLRAPLDRSGIREMLNAVRSIESTQDAASARSFWWVATGFLSALAEGSVADEASVKQLCARIDLQIRRLLEGSKNVAERLMRDALYFVASADSDNSAVQLVKTTYQLQSVIPSSETVAPAPEEAVRRKLRDVIATTEEAWNKYCAGTVQALPLFKESSSALSAVVEQLGQTDFRRLAQAILAAANWLVDDTARHSDGLAMEIATAILLTQNAQENFQRLGGDFAHQVDVTVERIHACLAGAPLPAGSEIPLLDEMSRRAQEKLLIGQVAKEMQSNLAQIEQVLDGFFRDIEKRTDLASLEKPLRQVIGALSMMRHDGAVSALRECATEIKRFEDSAYHPQDEDFERVASQLSVVGFFIDSLQHGAVDFESFVGRMQAEPSSDLDESEEDEGELEVSVEQEVEQQKLETHALLSAYKDQQSDSSLREEIKQNLVALKNDADLVADVSLGEQTKAMLSALEAGEDASTQIDQVMATLKPQSSEPPRPSQETIQLSQSSTEEIDAELLGIFLEEANEVLGTIDENLVALKGQSHNTELLTTIRRSFHTLKGSGRMVGLKDVGEAAWAIEQTLNLWLRQEIEVGASILGLLDLSLATFKEWILFLEGQTTRAPDPSEMVALADSLRRAQEDKPLESAAPLVTSSVVAAEDSESTSEASEETDAPIDATSPADEVLASAEIITLDSYRAEGHDFTIDVEAVDMVEADQGNEIDVVPSATDESQSDGDVTVVEPVPESLVSTELPAQRIVISPALYEIFSDEAKGHLATLQRELAVLEKNSSGSTPHDMYRAAHTLAGISATVGIAPVNQLGVALEHALLRRDNSTHPESLEALGLIGRSIGEVEMMLLALADQRELEVPYALISDLEALYPANVISVQAVEPESESATDIVAPDPEETFEAASSGQPESGPGQVPVAAPAPTGFAVDVRSLQDEIDDQLLPIFLEEAVDLVQGITPQLRAWRNAPDSMDAVRMLLRQFHTLKGSARMAGAMNLGEITHAIESHIERASQSGVTPIEVIDEIVNAFDVVQHIIESLQRGETPVQPLVVPDAPVSAPETEAPAVSVAVAPTVERRADRSRSTDADAAESDVAAQRATLRVKADLIDRLVNQAGELSIARARIEGEMRSLKQSLLDLTENVIRLRRQLREIEIQAESQMQSRTASADELHPGFDPLEFDRFTRFQELTRMMAESVNDVSTVQQNLLKNLDDANAAIIDQARLNREVQQELMSVRMVPFGSLADRLYRIVRQTTKELNKRANLEIKGSQVELDRSVLDKISAPLEHMLRNAVAHGLEERDVRVARGKPDIGEISLSLKQEGNEIILSLSDDGAGLNLDRIRARAVESGLLSEDEAVDNARLADMIFTPGFSTASEVSQIAGRGVGMDVVKTEVTSIGGRIEILSTAGSGTEFRLYIPLTLAVTKALMVRASNKTYAIPSVMIEQVLDLKEVALTRIRDAGTAEWMGHHYPFSYLPHLLGDTQALPEQHRQYWTLLLRSGTRRISVQVDELLGNQEIVVKNIGPQLARVIGIDGATVLGNGQVVLILNPVALSSRAPVAEFASPVPTAPVVVEKEAVAAVLPTVMVVDDSLTVRKITGRLLAREGYQVLVAKDGVEALEQLLDVVPDVMLVDIEMPRMDGFDLTRNIRADARLKHIPIIMITSRTADKHREYAFEIGVNQYLGKPYQEEELLKFVGEYVTQQRHA